MNQLTVKKLVEKLVEAKEAYYNGNQIMDDFTFDTYEDQLRQLDPANDYFKIVGSGPKGRKELIKDIEAKGYQFTDTINKDTNILICEDINGNSTKLQKATKLGIKLMSYTEFFN